jgi:hypothetical protein
MSYGVLEIIVSSVMERSLDISEILQDAAALFFQST